MRVIADLHGGDPNNEAAIAEFQEIRHKVMDELNSGEPRDYATMWRKYKRRVLLAMSSQAFAQLVSLDSTSGVSRAFIDPWSYIERNKWYAPR